MALMAEYGKDALVDVRVSSRELSHDERKELVIRLHENTVECDFVGLGNLFDFEELEEWGMDEGLLEHLGFDDEDPGEDPGPQIDRAEELREKWGVETGQLWQLESHRLVCGDCTTTLRPPQNRVRSHVLAPRRVGLALLYTRCPWASATLLLP